MNNELTLAGLQNINRENVIDTLVIARDKFPGSSISLDALCKRYRIDNSRRDKHNAILDCELLSKVYINLLDQKEPALNFIEGDNKFSEKSSNLKAKIIIIKLYPLQIRKFQSINFFKKSKLKKNFFLI